MKELPMKSYGPLLEDIAQVLAKSRRQAAKTVNAILAATYWKIGRHIVEFQQKGEERAAYGEALLKRLSKDLIARFGRGFSEDNLENMRQFYLTYPLEKISETLSRKLSVSQKSETVSRIFDLADLTSAFTLSWSHYVLLVKRSRSPEARGFYEAEALSGGWSVRAADQLPVLRAHSAFKEQSGHAPEGRRTAAGRYRIPGSIYPSDL